MASKKNITLAIDEDLLVKARVAALRRRISLTSYVRQCIQELVSGDRLQSQAVARLRSRMRNPAMHVGRARWTRDEIHERP
jgi:hypothetical protein